MAKTPPRWERLRPSQGKNGTPGRRLLSADDEVQVQFYRQRHGAHAGWTMLWEWQKSRDQWEILVRSENSDIVAQAFGRTVPEVYETANEIVVAKNHPPLPPL